MTPAHPTEAELRQWDLENDWQPSRLDRLLAAARDRNRLEEREKYLEAAVAASLDRHHRTLSSWEATLGREVRIREERDRLEGALRGVEDLLRTGSWLGFPRAQRATQKADMIARALAGRAGEGGLDEGGSTERRAGTPGIREEAATAHDRTSTAQDAAAGRGNSEPGTNSGPPSSSPAAAQGPIAIQQALQRARSALIDLRSGQCTGRRNAEGDGVWLQLFDAYFEEYLDPLIADCAAALNAPAPTPAAAGERCGTSNLNSPRACALPTGHAGGHVDKDGYEIHQPPVEPEPAGGEVDPLHPNGSCSCYGEGRCMWCLLTRISELETTVRDEMNARAQQPVVAECYQDAMETAGRNIQAYQRAAADRDTARAEAEALRTERDSVKQWAERAAENYRVQYAEMERQLAHANTQWNACYTRAGEAERQIEMFQVTAQNDNAEILRLQADRTSLLARIEQLERELKGVGIALKFTEAVQAIEGICLEENIYQNDREEMREEIRTVLRKAGLKED